MTDIQKGDQISDVGRRPWLTKNRRAQLFGIALLTPALLVFALVIVSPLIQGVALGFYRVAQITLKTRFVGFDNFRASLEFGAFTDALVVTLEFTVFGLLLQILLGTGVALLLNQKFFGRSIARSLALFPYLVPVVVSAMIWQWMLSDTYGIVDSLLQRWGIIDAPIAWFADPNIALISVILVGSWRVFPFMVIAILGRLQSIPNQLYEAARTDGASSWSMFFDITLPQLRSVLVVSVFIRAIWNFNDFNTIALLTNGGPAGRTLTLPILIYQLGFGQFELGAAAAVADLMLIVLTIFFVLYFWIAKPLGETR